MRGFLSRIIEGGETATHSDELPEVLQSAMINKIGLQRAKGSDQTRRFQNRIEKTGKVAKEEIVVQVSKNEEEIFDLSDFGLSDGERRRRIASALIMIGALIRILSGTSSQGNPSGLLNSSIFNHRIVRHTRFRT